MSAAIAGPASAISAAVPRRNFRMTRAPRDDERTVCNESAWNAVADQPQPAWICEGQVGWQSGALRRSVNSASAKEAHRQIALL